MPSFAAFLAHPAKRRPSPPPPQADLRTVFQLGMTLWAVALVVSLVLLLAGSGDLRVIATCGAGIGLGGLGLLWARRHPEGVPPEEPAAGGAPGTTEGAEGAPPGERAEATPAAAERPEQEEPAKDPKAENTPDAE